MLVDPETQSEEDAEILQAVQGVRHIILVFTKADLRPEDKNVWSTGGLRVDAAVSVSAQTGYHLDLLSRAVERLFPMDEAPAGEILTNARQADAVQRALTSLGAARQAMGSGCTPDAVLTETELAMEALGELSGKTVREDITGRIFERFCVGK